MDLNTWSKDMKRLEDKLDKINDKMDQLLVSTTENKMEIKNHTTWDKKVHSVVWGLVIFVFSMHAAEAVEFIMKFL